MDIIAEQVNIGSFNVSGTVINIIGGVKSGYSQPLGFIKADGTIAWYRINITSSVIEETLTLSSNKVFPQPIAVVGDGTNQVFPSSSGPVILSNKIQATLMGFTVLPTASITGTYTFYVSLVDGTFYLYNLQLSSLTIWVKDPTRFDVLSIPPPGMMGITFSDPSVSIVSGYVLNPKALGQLTMTAPRQAIIDIHVVG
jgi:hypothetical protein